MKTENKTLSAQSKLFVLFFIIVLIIFSILIFWGITIKMPYMRYEQALNAYIQENLNADMEFDPSILSPRFLRNNGKLYVEKNESSNLRIVLTVVPDFFGNHKYSIFITDKEQNINETMIIDKNVHYLPSDADNIELTQKKEKILSQYYEQVEKLMQAANELWKLN